MDYQLAAINSQGSFDLIDKNSLVVSTLEHKNWLSATASATIAGRLLQIKSVGWLTSEFTILLDEQVRGTVTYNWKSQARISLQPDIGLPWSFVLKAKGFWQQYFVLEDESGHTVLDMRPTFKWKKMHYDHTVQFPETDWTDFDRQLLVLVCGYCANYYLNLAATSAGS